MIGYREGVAIGELVVYVPALSIAIFLAVKHGFGRSAGWFFLIMLSLARIIGAAMQIAIVSNPTSISLYTGSAILTNTGFSPLMLATLGLLSRLLDSINRSKKTIINTQMLKLIELIIVVGFILGIVGGTEAGTNFSKTGTFVPSALNKAGTALLVVSFAITVIFIAIVSFDSPHAEAGEHRLFFAIVVSVPFMIVRLVYSCLSTFTHNKAFSLISGNETILLCVALLEELVVVIIYEGVGLTLRKLPKALPVGSRDSSEPMQGGQPKKDNMALKIFKHTILGRIVFAFIPDKKSNDHDVEMQHQQQYVQK
jgi:hypothetical protein